MYLEKDTISRISTQTLLTRFLKIHCKGRREAQEQINLSGKYGPYLDPSSNQQNRTKTITYEIDEACRNLIEGQRFQTEGIMANSEE